MTALSHGVRDAVRRLYEGGCADIDLLAAAARIRPATITHLADTEGWVSPGAPSKGGGAGEPDRTARVAALADRLIREIEDIERDGQGGAYDKLRIDGVTALTRALEKLGEFAQGAAGRQEAAKRTDEEIAVALARIDQRIVELALDYAGRLDAERTDRAAAEAGH